MTAYRAELEHRSPNANVRAGNAWAHLSTVFGHLRPDQIDRPLCRAYAARRRRQGAAEGTILKELSILRTALYRADKACPAVFEMPTPPDPRDRHLTRDEYAALLETCEHAHIRLFCVLALGTAARKEALLELTWDRVDFERGTIRLATGTEGRRKGRATVPMSARVRAELEAAYKARTCEHVIEYAGRRVGNVKKGVRAALVRIGVYAKGDGAHILRHTAAVWMAEGGIPMAQIAQFLGHSDSRITERVYARFSPGFLRAAASVLD